MLDIERELAADALASARVRGEPLEGVRVGSIDVVTALRARFPENDFSWILGAQPTRDLSARKPRHPAGTGLGAVCTGDERLTVAAHGERSCRVTSSACVLATQGRTRFAT